MRISRTIRGTTSRWKPKPSVPDHSLRVEITLWEKYLDAARESAHEGICNRNLLITLAGKLESSRSGDADSLYRRELMKAQGLSRQFGDYLAELRVQFKPKRNFIKLMDEVACSAAKWVSTP
jgi:hypothetical protein